MICHRLIRIQRAVLTALVSSPTLLKHQFTLSSVLSLFLPLRAKRSGGDEGHGPGVQQRSHPVQQLCQLRRGRYRTAGIPDRHRLEPVTLPTFHTVFKDIQRPTHLQQLFCSPVCLLLPQSRRPCGFFAGKCSETIFEDMREPPKKPLHLKGQMKYVPQWDSLIFLGTPM